MTTYVMFYPSGRLFKDGVEFPSDDRDPTFQEYADWLAAGNGPDYVPDPPAPEPTATAAQVAAAMQLLGVTAVDTNEMSNSVFPLAVTL